MLYQCFKTITSGECIVIVTGCVCSSSSTDVDAMASCDDVSTEFVSESSPAAVSSSGNPQADQQTDADSAERTAAAESQPQLVDSTADGGAVFKPEAGDGGAQAHVDVSSAAAAVQSPQQMDTASDAISSANDFDDSDDLSDNFKYVLSVLCTATICQCKCTISCVCAYLCSIVITASVCVVFVFQFPDRSDGQKDVARRRR